MFGPQSYHLSFTVMIIHFEATFIHTIHITTVPIAIPDQQPPN